MVFSEFNLQKGYYQVPVALEDIQKTSIITPFGMYKFLCMPIGLCSAGYIFQHLTFCFVYLDNILSFSRYLSSHGLPKCEFAVSKIEFLGHLLSTT